MENRQQLNEFWPLVARAAGAALPFIKKALPHLLPALGGSAVDAAKFVVKPGFGKLQKDILFSDPSGEGIGKSTSAAAIADLPGKVTDKASDAVKQRINDAGKAWRETVRGEDPNSIGNVADRRFRLRDNMDIFKRNYETIRSKRN